MSASIRKGSWFVAAFTMAALAGCGDGDESPAEPTTNIDSTGPASPYRIEDTDRHHEILADRALTERDAIRQLTTGSSVRPLPGREATPGSGAAESDR